MSSANSENTRLYRTRLLSVCPALVMAASLIGCGGGQDELPGRVAVDVVVTVKGAPAGDGRLVLRPEPGIRCPLVTITISQGRGYLSAAEGPVPGAYVAAFEPAANRPDAALSGGRTLSESSKSVKVPSPLERSGKGGSTIRTLPLSVPAADPAQITADFDS
ncbi:MAG: hypothetical protein R3C49_23505 [Planctomycetaceae bacterium]